MKKYIALALAAAMAMSMGSALAEECPCGENWKELTEAILTDNTDGSGAKCIPAGSYCVKADMNLVEYLRVESGTVNLCLHGGSVTSKGLTVGFDDSTATLNLYACGSGSLSGSDRGALVNPKAVFNMHGGRLTSENQGVVNDGAFTMYGGGVTGEEEGVDNYGAFKMYGGSVTGEEEGVDNYGAFTMYGGSVTSEEEGVDNEGTFTMHGGSVTGELDGVNNEGTFTISEGTITGGNESQTNMAVYGAAEDEAILPGSYKVSGAFHEKQVVVARTSDMPQTGDGSRLALWFSLLSMAGAGMISLRRRAYH